MLVHNSHKIKSADGNASRLLARVTPYVRRRAILTGTVMPHSPLDVFGQWRFLDPLAFGHLDDHGHVMPATWGEFGKDYSQPGGFMGHEVRRYVNLDRMQEIMARNAVVARKADSLPDLPRVTEIVLPVHLEPQEKQAYREMKRDLQAQLASGALSTVPNKLAQMMRLRQITSGHLPDDHGLVHRIGRSKTRTIVEHVNSTLAGEARVVVFCLFIHEIVDLAAQLALGETGRRTEVMAITGATSPSERALMRKRFGSDDPQRMVIVAQVRTMSLAVNELVTASHAVFGSLSNQRDDLVQAKDRLDRQGQTRPVTFWFALAPGTVDEVIKRSHDDRTDLESAMLAHIKEEGE